MKRDLYIDCDGVIFDTIKYAFNEMRRLGVDLSNDELITKYFKEVDWNNLITKSGIINNIINKINLLKESDVFDLVCVLTHRCSWNEGVIKDEKFIEGNEVGFYDDVGIRYKLLKTQYTTPKMICLFEEGIQGDYICEKYELTKENYIKACRKCVELFLGSDVEI